MKLAVHVRTATSAERSTFAISSPSQTRVSEVASGLYRLNEDQIAERGARMARRDDREYREYLREEQRSQPGCPAREVVLDQPIQATSLST
jgi:hypothetical protein